MKYNQKRKRWLSTQKFYHKYEGKDFKTGNLIVYYDFFDKNLNDGANSLMKESKYDNYVIKTRKNRKSASRTRFLATWPTNRPN